MIAARLQGVSVSQIRVILATMPPLLGDIVRESLSRDAEIEILAEVQSRSDIRAAVERTAAEVVVLGVAADEWTGLSGTLRDLLAQYPRLTIVALASDGRGAYVYQLQPRGVAIRDISPRSLAQTIRSVSPADVHPSLHPFSAE